MFVRVRPGRYRETTMTDSYKLSTTSIPILPMMITPRNMSMFTLSILQGLFDNYGNLFLNHKHESRTQYASRQFRPQSNKQGL